MNDDQEGYAGPATVVLGDRTYDVRVRLAGYFQPLDGRYHWYGRLEVHRELAGQVGDGSAEVLLRTPQGAAAGRLGEPDLWGRYRVEGVSTPPFALAATLEELDEAVTHVR